ncbi:hypothetical protein CEXT_532031 [Caerostris extrusa]|uniref:Uncharacterized protein n=1 Tax=Caerostris extrusa TaxID=172846 RepID=A0AAV4RSL5_CAEEX|nr:hypothetical protein CEXT_532031 [Caerostris extrusa]
MTPTPKIHKKKLSRRDSLRLAINKDEPPLFSQPDVLRKISIDNNTCKKDGRDSDSNLLNECDGESKVKTINAPTSKNIEKEKQNLKNKQSVKPTLKLDKKEIAEERRCEKKKDSVNEVEKEKKILKAEQVKKEQKPFKIKHEVKEENGKRSQQENKKNERHEKKVEKEKRKEKLSTSQSKDKICSIAVKQENDKPRKSLIKTNDSHENRSMYCNIETLFETAKLHLLSDEDKLLNNFNDKDLSIAEEKDGINSALIKITNDSCSKETVIEAETDKHMLPVMATNNEEKLKPERKSCRIIKRKEFLETLLILLTLKKFPGVQNRGRPRFLSVLIGDTEEVWRKGFRVEALQDIALLPFAALLAG